MTKNQAIEKIANTMFPAAKNGDDVLFEGYWFLMANDEWVIDDSKTHPAEGSVNE